LSIRPNEVLEHPAVIESYFGSPAFMKERP